MYVRGSHLGHVTSIMSSNFHFLVPESVHKKLVQNGIVVSEKTRFEFGSRSRNEFDPKYSHTFINSIRCLLLPTFRSLAAVLSERSTVFTFFCRNAYVSKFDLGVH